MSNDSKYQVSDAVIEIRVALSNVKSALTRLSELGVDLPHATKMVGHVSSIFSSDYLSDIEPRDVEVRTSNLIELTEDDIVHTDDASSYNVAKDDGVYPTSEEE